MKSCFKYVIVSKRTIRAIKMIRYITVISGFSLFFRFIPGFQPVKMVITKKNDDRYDKNYNTSNAYSEM